MKTSYALICALALMVGVGAFGALGSSFDQSVRGAVASRSATQQAQGVELGSTHLGIVQHVARLARRASDALGGVAERLGGRTHMADRLGRKIDLDPPPEQAPLASLLLGAEPDWPRFDGPPLRLGLVGAPSTGKSTLGVELSKRLGLFRLDDPARVGAAVGVWDLQNRALDADMALVKGRLREEVGLHRFLADYPARYSLVYLDAQWSGDPAAMARVDALRAAADWSQTQYDGLIYLPADDIPLIDDGFRHTDNGFRDAIDAEIHRLVRSSGVPWLEVRGDVPTRIAQVEAFLLELDAAQ